VTALLLWVLSVGLAPNLEEPAPDADRVESAVRRALGGDKVKFCRDRRYPLVSDEKEWCRLVGDETPRCPAFAEACKAGGTYPGSGGPPSEARQRAARGTERKESEQYTLALPHFGGLGLLLLWVLLIGGLGALVWAIVRGSWRARSERGKDEAEPGEPEAMPMPRSSAVETDVERLLARARAAAARGEFGRALDDTYAALLRRFEGDGLIRLHPSRTNGDYVRDLRERPELKSELSDIARQVERVHFGAETPSSLRFETVFSRVLPLARKSLATFALALCLLSGASCRKVSRGAWEDSPSGYSAVMRVLTEAGLEPRHRLEALTKLGPNEQVLVLLPGVEVGAGEWRALLGWANEGGVLVVAAPELDLPAELGLRRVTAPTAQAEPLAVSEAFDEVFQAAKVVLPSQERLVVDQKEWSYLLLADRAGPYAVWLDWSREEGPMAEDPDDDGDDDDDDGGTIVVLADGTLMTNAALVLGDNARFLVELLEGFGTKVDFADDTTGMAPATPMASVARSKLLPLLLQLAFFLTVFFLFKGALFGAAREPLVRTRRAFADHVRALGTQYGKARAGRHVLALYGAYAIERLRERVALGGKRGLIPVAEAVAQKSGRPVADVMRLLVEAQSAREAVPGRERRSATAAAQDLAIVRGLSQLLREMGGTR
jgi:hypothetical protein